MKKLTGLIICACAAVSLADNPAAEKPKFDLYGFVKGDMYYASAGVKSFGQPSLVAVNQATGSDTSAMSFTAQHSRFGLKGSGMAGDVTMGGQIEADFYTNAANAGGKARIRLAYAWCKPIQDLDLRFGQQWDIYSPLNPTTINTSGNMWYDGNLGARRAQVQVRYGKDLGIVKPMVQVSAGEATSENELKVTQAADTSKKVTAGEYLGLDNLSKRPLIQGRIGVGIIGTAEIGFSAAYAGYGKDNDFTTQGIAFDLDLPINKYLALKAEYGSGTNLTNAGFLGIADARTLAGTDVESSAFWVNAITKPYPFFNAVIGFGQDQITSAVAPNKIESNIAFYGDLIFPIGKFFVLTVEYEYLSTTLKGVSEAKTANVIDLAGQVNF